MSEKVLITGGHGDIAQALVRDLETTNKYEVWAPGSCELDVTDWTSIERAVLKFIPDVLVNNAGYVSPQEIGNASLEETKKHIDINLGGTFYCTEIALKYNSRLKIVNIGSSAATKIHATWSEYCASKAAVVMATKCWAKAGYYAVCVSPGRTRTKMRKFLYPLEDPNTLMDPRDFSKVVMAAIECKFPSGAHINVHKEDIPKLFRELSLKQEVKE